MKLVESLPFLNLLSEDARIPITSAVPNPISVATGESSIKDELSKLTYLLPPTGGSQIKKSIEGLKTVNNKGSYVTNSKGEKELRFPVENPTAKDYIKAVTLGKYALPLAKEYVDRNYKRLSAKQTKTYEEANLPYKEYLEYLDAGFKKTTDKIEYINNKDMTTEQKWGIYKNDIFSNDERDDGGSQLKDAEYITSNGVSKERYINIYNKAQKNNIKMPTESEYKEIKKNKIGLEGYINYKIAEKNKTKEKQKSENDENAKLNSKEKIQILVNSKYTDTEKKALYSLEINSKDKTYSNLSKITNVNIDAYLDYKLQDIEGDEDKESDVKGATVWGSKKENFIQYLNKSNLSGVERLYIYGKNYKYTNSQRQQMINFVKKASLSSKEQIEVYKGLTKNIEEHKNGKYYWK